MFVIIVRNIFLSLRIRLGDRAAWSGDDFVYEISLILLLGNVQISYDGFLSNFRPLLLYDGIMTFSANLLPPFDVFNQPLPHIYRK